MIGTFGIAALVDGVIAFTLVEAVLLALYHRRTGKGAAPRDFAANMVSGLFLMLALRCVAHDAGTARTALCLLAAGIAHGSDLWMRWRGARTPRATIESRRLA